MTTYDSLWAAKAQPVDDALEEQALIAAAKDGDSDAIHRLFLAYVAVLNKAVAVYAPALGPDRDAAHAEAQSLAYLALMETIQNHDIERDRLALTIRFILARTFESASGSHNPVYVPSRMRARYFSLMAAAEEDVDRAIQMAPKHGFPAVETFVAVYEAINNVKWYQDTSVEGLSEFDNNTGEDMLVATDITPEQEQTDNEMTVQTAFAAVNDEERTITRLYYGFDGDDSNIGSDYQVGRVIGSTRPTVQRKRTKALDKMREAVGVSRA